MQVLQGYGLQRKVIHYYSNFSIFNEYVRKFVNTVQSLHTSVFRYQDNSSKYFSMDFLLFFCMSFNNKLYFLSQDNIFLTSSLQLIVLATKICPQGEKVLVHLETKVFYLWYLLQHRHINHPIVTQVYLQKMEVFWQNWFHQPWQFVFLICCINSDIWN